MKLVHVVQSVFVLLLVALLYEGCQFSTAKIKEVVLCKKFDAEGLPAEKTNTFDISDASIHCGVLTKNIPADTKLKAIWYQINSKTNERKEMIQSDFSVSDDRWINFFITPPAAGFAAGKYAVDIYLNNKLDNSQSFTIQGPSQNPLVQSVVIAATSASTGKLTEMYTFHPDIDVIHAQVDFKDAPANTKFTAVWYQHDASTNARAKIVMTDIETSGTDFIDFTFTPSAPLPVSRYSADILVNGIVSNTLLFDVK